MNIEYPALETDVKLSKLN